VVFDWYATLAAPNPDDFWNGIPELIQGAGGVVDPAALHEWEVAHPLVHVEQSADEPTYRAWQRARLDELFARSGLVDPSRRELVDRIEEVRYARSFTVFPGVPELLAELRGRGLTTGICSNWDWDLDRHLAANGIDDLLDVVVCSAVVGHRKPHPTIFQLVLDGVACPAGEVVFVGDNWAADVEAATAAGMRAVHVSTGDGCADLDHGPVPCLDDVTGVVDLL
jgi:HAD superfamily hydrolase (TIGR01509 family)